MMKIWLESAHPNADVDIVAIPDIDDPPNWVSHASRYHGEAGQLFTSDERTTELYAAAGWPTISSPLEARESWEGWRIRGTLRMLSTVSDREPAIEVMSATIPRSVSEFLYDEGLLHRQLNLLLEHILRWSYLRLQYMHHWLYLNPHLGFAYSIQKHFRLGLKY